MKLKSYLLSAIIVLMLLPQGSNAQAFLKKLKEKAKQEVVKQVLGEDEEKKEGENNASNNSETANKPATRNTTGAGLNKTRPDVKENIKTAISEFDAKNFSETRFAIRQALMGIELEIGDNILTSLPDAIKGIAKDAAQDQVTSTGIGFVGLVIQRVYVEDGKEFRITIGNDAAMLSAVNMYLSAGTYAATTDENVKITRFKDNKAVIQYEDDSGYELSVPFGQSSVLILQGINFANEDSFMEAANEIDLNKIKKHLGEE